MNEVDKSKQFLKELTALSLKYDRWISGCGCCDSPLAQPFDPEYYEEGYVSAEIEEDDGTIVFLRVKTKDE